MKQSQRHEHLIKTITITSGKGGVGKTNIVANLAIALQRKGRKVLIFDADLGLCNIDVLLGLAPKFNIHHMLRGECSIREIMVKGPEGILILPASSGVEELTHLDEFQRLRLLEEFETLPKDLDYILIDTSAGISSNVTFFCLGAQETVVVITPEPTSLTDAYALIKVLFTKYQEKEFRILVNNVKSSKEALEVFRRLYVVTERFLNISLDYLGFIPYDAELQKAVRSQEPVIIKKPQSPSSRAFSDIAIKLDNMDFNAVKGGIQFFFGNLLGIHDNARV